jgi:hypothetical protein
MPRDGERKTETKDKKITLNERILWKIERKKGRAKERTIRETRIKNIWQSPNITLKPKSNKRAIIKNQS